MTDKQLSKIVRTIGRRFRCFGKGTPPVEGEHLFVALNDKPTVFAAGVDVRSVVEFVLSEAKKARAA